MAGVPLRRALGCTPNDLLGCPADKPFSDRTLAALEEFRKLPLSDPRRRAVEVLLGIDESKEPEEGEKDG